jgi:FkbM family methyltransferase
MKNLKDQVEFRTKKIDPRVPDDRWMWPKQDTGAWHGPILNWENDHIHKYFKNVTNYKTVVTAGANCGLHVRVYAHLFEKVYAFEPHWLNFYCLSYNTPYNNVFKYQAALGAKSGQFVGMNQEPAGNMGAYTVAIGTGNIPVMTIDSFNLHDVGLIQLDAEGFEGNIIEGAKETIIRCRPVVIVERQTAPMADFLKSNGYLFQEKSASDMIFYPGPR